MKYSTYLLASILFLSFSCKKRDENLQQRFGTIVSIKSGGVNDAVFKLDNNDTLFYINRKLENVLDLDRLKKNYLGKKAEIIFIPSHSILEDKSKISQNILKLKIDGEVVFAEN